VGPADRMAPPGSISISFAPADSMGQSLGPARETMSIRDLPDSLHHEIVVRVVAERWSAGAPSEQRVLESTLRPSELIDNGRTAVLAGRLALRRDPRNRRPAHEPPHRRPSAAPLERRRWSRAPAPRARRCSNRVSGPSGSGSALEGSGAASVRCCKS